MSYNIGEILIRSLSRSVEVGLIKLVEGSYINAFFNNVGTLNNYYAQYQNLMLEIKFIYGNVDNIKKAENISDEQKEAIRTATQSLRIITTQTYMQYESLKKQLKIGQEQEKEVQEAYTKITEEYIPETKEIKRYVLALNQVLTNDIMQELFDKSQEILNIKNG